MRAEFKPILIGLEKSQQRKSIKTIFSSHWIVGLCALYNSNQNRNVSTIDRQFAFISNNPNRKTDEWDFSHLGWLASVLLCPSSFNTNIPTINTQIFIRIIPAEKLPSNPRVILDGWPLFRCTPPTPDHAFAVTSIQGPVSHSRKVHDISISSCMYIYNTFKKAS